MIRGSWHLPSSCSLTRSVRDRRVSSLVPSLSVIGLLVCSCPLFTTRTRRSCTSLGSLRLSPVPTNRSWTKDSLPVNSPLGLSLVLNLSTSLQPNVPVSLFSTSGLSFASVGPTPTRSSGYTRVPRRTHKSTNLPSVYSDTRLLDRPRLSPLSRNFRIP